jgi:hypothetical protein
MPRMNEYFLPRDGIDREVIQADICRYLGNDALVRPGTYEVTSHITPSTTLSSLAHYVFTRRSLSRLTTLHAAEPSNSANVAGLLHNSLPQPDIREHPQYRRVASLTP